MSARVDLLAKPDPEQHAVVVTAGDVSPEPIEWLWRDRIAIGKLTLVAGDPGLGKSLLTTTITAHITRARAWPVEGSACPLGDVVMLSAEDDVADTIRPRLDAAGADATRVHCVTAVRTVNPAGRSQDRMWSLTQDLHLLERVLDQHQATQLVIVDPLAAYMPGTDSHRDSDVRGVLAPLAELASRRRVAVVCIAHTRKSQAANALHRVGGSIAFTAAARVALVVVRDPDNDDRRFIVAAKSNIGVTPQALAYFVRVDEEGRPVLTWHPDPVTVNVDEVVGGDEKAAEARSARADAIGFLRDLLANGSMPAKQVRAEAEADGHKWRTVQRAARAANVEIDRSGFSGGSVWTLVRANPRQPSPSGASGANGANGGEL